MGVQNLEIKLWNYGQKKPLVMHSRAIRKWVKGGFFLEETRRGDLFGYKDAESTHIYGFDKNSQQYQARPVRRRDLRHLQLPGEVRRRGEENHHARQLGSSPGQGDRADGGRRTEGREADLHGLWSGRVWGKKDSRARASRPHLYEARKEGIKEGADGVDRGAGRPWPLHGLLVRLVLPADLTTDPRPSATRGIGSSAYSSLEVGGGITILVELALNLVPFDKMPPTTMSTSGPSVSRNVR